MSEGSKGRMKEGGTGNKPQHTGVYTRGPLTHLPSSHLLSPLNTALSTSRFVRVIRTQGPY